MALDRFWLNHKCYGLKSCRKQIGAATFHPKTIKCIINSSNLNFCFLQLTNRPYDCNFGLNHKQQKYFQYQVLIQPFYGLPGSLCFKSFQEIGLTYNIIFRKSHWKGTTLNAWGKGWECLVDSVEICQITMFHQVCGLRFKYPILEITYGLERLRLIVANVRSMISWTEIIDCYINISLLSYYNILKSISKIKNQLIECKNSKYYPRYFMFLKLVEMYNYLKTSYKLNPLLIRCVLNKVQDNIRFVIGDSIKS